MSFEAIERQIEKLEGPIGPLMYQHDNGIGVTVDAAESLRLLLAVARAAGDYRNAELRGLRGLLEGVRALDRLALALAELKAHCGEGA